MTPEKCLDDLKRLDSARAALVRPQGRASTHVNTEIATITLLDVVRDILQHLAEERAP